MKAKFDKSVVMEACKRKVQEINDKRKEEYEQAIAELMKPYSYFFGLIKGQKTREQAEKELNYSAGELMFSDADLIKRTYRDKEIFCKKVFLVCDDSSSDYVYLTEEDYTKIFA